MKNMFFRNETNLRRGLYIVATSFCMTLLSVVAHSQERPAPAKQPLFENPVVAQGEDFKIYKNELEEEYIIYKNETERNGRIKLNKNLKHVYEKNLLKRIVFSKLLQSKSTEEEKKSAKDLTNLIIQQNLSSDIKKQSFKAQILALGLTEEKYIKKLEERKLADTVLFRLMDSMIKVGATEIKAYYDSNPSLFEVPTQYKVAHIMLSTRMPASSESISFADMVKKKGEAESIAEEAKKEGADFEALVSKYSEDPRTKSRGGVYEFVAGSLDPDFEKVAMQMVPGQISDPVKSKYGFHIIKFIEMKPSKMEPLEGKLAEDITNHLKSQKLQKNLQAFQDKLIAESDVEFLLSSEK